VLDDADALLYEENTSGRPGPFSTAPAAPPTVPEIAYR
jgi:hypothetical protein